MGFSSSEAPTLGVSVTSHEMNGMGLRIFDVGGQTQFRKRWFTTVKRPDGVVFVHDLANISARQAESQEWFVNMLLWFEDAGISMPLLILGNKIDLVKAPSLDQLSAALDLNEFGYDPMQSVLTSAVTGEGIDEAFHWLIAQM